MLLRLLLYGALVVLVYHVIKRVLGLALTHIAKGKSLHFEVKGVGFGLIQGLHIHLPKGPLSDVRVEEISLGHTRGARKLYDGITRAATTFNWRLPFTVRGVRLELRTRAAGRGSGHAKRRRKPLDIGRVVASLAARGLLGILPFVPVRVKDVVLVHQATGIVLDVRRIELIIKSPRLFTELQATLDCAPVSVRLECPTDGESSASRLASDGPSAPAVHSIPILDVLDTRLGMELHWAREGFGMRCESLTCGIGVISASISLPLLMALAKLPASAKRREAQRVAEHHDRSSIEAAVGTLPAHLKVSLPLIQLKSEGLGLQQKLGACIEVHQVSLVGSRPAVEEEGREEELYRTAFTTGDLKARGGVASEPDVVVVSCPGLGLEGILLQKEDPSSTSAPGGHFVRLEGGLQALSTTLCPASAFNSVAVAKDIQLLLGQQAGQVGSADVELIEKGSLVDSALSTAAVAASKASVATPGVVVKKASLVRQRRSLSTETPGAPFREPEDAQTGSIEAATPHERGSFQATAQTRELQEDRSQEPACFSGRHPRHRLQNLDWEFSTHLAEESSLVFQDQRGTQLVCCAFAEATIWGGSTGLDPQLGMGASGGLQKQSHMKFEVKEGIVRLWDSCKAAPQETWQVCRVEELLIGGSTVGADESQTVKLGLIGTLSISGLTFAAAEERLQSLMSVVQSMQPPPEARKHGNVHRDSKKMPRDDQMQDPARPSKSKKVKLVGISLQLSQIAAEYVTSMVIPEAWQIEPLPGGQQKSIQALHMGQVAAQVDLEKQAVAASMTDTRVTFAFGDQAVRRQAPSLQLTRVEVTAKKIASSDVAAYDFGTAPRICASLDLSGLSGRFEADPIFAACKLAADLQSAAAQMGGSTSSTQLAQAAQTGEASDSSRGDAGTEDAMMKPKQWKMSGASLDVILQSISLEAKLSQDVVWGLSLQRAQAGLQPQNATLSDVAFRLNNAELARISGVVLSLHTKDRKGAWPAFKGPLSRRTTVEETALEDISVQHDVPVSPQGGNVVAVEPPKSRPPSGSRRSCAVSQESLPSVTEGSDVDVTSPSITAGRGPVQPISENTPSLTAAYCRAGLSEWVDSGPPSPGTPVPHQQQTLARPKLVVECCLCDVLVTLPYDQDPGTAQRFTELWAKAFQEALSTHLGSLRKRKDEPPQKVATPSHSEEPIELRLALRGILFKMDHHPMEAWLAVKGPLLKAVATQDSLWSRALDAVTPTATSCRDGESPLASLNPSGRHKLGGHLAVSSEISRSYCSKAAQAVTDQRLGTRQGALMHARAEAVDALVVICGSDPQTLASAQQSITELDAASGGVPMRQVRRLQLDVVIGNTGVYFSCASRPLAAVSGATISGALMTGRQVTAPPKQYSRSMMVGHCRRIQIPVTVKGSRALIKVYTDLKAAVDDPRVWYSIGLEPTIALVSQAGKRMSPSDPDKSRPKPPTLPWFDMMRFVWRGNLDLTARNFEFVLGAVADPNLHASSERLQADISSLSLSWKPESIHLAMEDLSACGYLAANLDEPAGMLHMLPLVDFPRCNIALEYQWLLPGGRSSLDHHLFPVPVPEGVQEPLDIVGLCKSSGVDLGLIVRCTGVTSAQQATSEAPAKASGEARRHSTAYTGGHQVAFVKLLIERLQCPPLWNKMVNRRGTYFQPADPKKTPALGIPKLIKKLDVSLRAPALDIVNYTVDLDEASCGLTFSTKEFVFSTSTLLNLPRPGPILPGYSAYSKKREAMRVASVLLHMDVEATEVRLHWKDATEWDKARYKQSQENFMKVQDKGTTLTSRISSVSAEALRTLMRNASSSEAFIVAISHVHVHETRTDPRDHAESDADCRPLRVAVKDSRFYVDTVGRNAVWGAVSHILCAIQLPRKHMPFTPNFVRADDDAAASATPPSGFGQKRSSRELSLHTADAEGSMPELLSLLLAQRDEQAVSDVEEEAIHGIPQSDHEVNSEDDDADVTVQDPKKLEAEDAVVRAQLRDANEVAKQKAWQEEEKQWIRGEPKWEVGLEGLQICLQASEAAGGRFMLAAERATLAGRHLAATQVNAIHLNVDKVQALVAQTGIDPGVSTSWLKYQDGRLHCGDTSQPASLREVFSPFSLKLRNTKVVPQPGRHSPSQAGRAGPGEETRLLVPFINVTMDSKDFNIMVDVINTIGLAEPPEVSAVKSDLPVLEQEESPEFSKMWETYTSLRSYLHALKSETFAMRSALGMRLQRDSSMGRNTYQPLSQSSFSLSRMDPLDIRKALNLAGALEEVPHIGDALADYLSRLSQSDSHHLGLALGPAMGQQLVLRWGQEQVEGAIQALHSTRKQLHALQKAVQKHKQARQATRFVLEVDGVTWALCQDRTPFLEIALATILLDNIRHRDRSGSSKLVIQHMEIVDATGSLAATPGTPKGAVLIPWNPDESWKRDALLRVNAVLGPPTSTHTVYEHVDVMMHPLGVHLVEAVATKFWEYFFPKEESAVVERQKKWVKSVEAKQSKPKHSRRGSAASNPGASSDSEAGPAPPASVFAAASGPTDVGLDSGSAATSTRASPGMTSVPGATSIVPGHRKFKSVDSDKVSEEVDRAGSPLQLDPTALQSEWLDNLLMQQSAALSSMGGSWAEQSRSSGHRRAASLDEIGGSAAAVTLPEGQEKQEKKPRRKKKDQQVQAAVRKVLFVHVRINRWHCRATYQGYPISFSDFKMVLDNRVYRSLDGRWRDLFQRIKWDTVKSVLKSVAGLQGRKFKELLPSWERGERQDTDKKASAVAIKSWITTLGKKKKGGEGEGGSPLDPTSLKEKAKSKLLLGSQHLSRSTHSAGHSSGLHTTATQQADSLQPWESDPSPSPEHEAPADLRSPSGGLPSPHKPPSGSQAARQASGVLLEHQPSSSAVLPPLLPDSSSRADRAQMDKVACEGIHGTHRVSIEGSTANDSPLAPADVTDRSSSTGGLNLADLLSTRRSSQEEPEPDTEVQTFTWGQDVPSARPAPTAKAKAARLFGMASSMLKEASNSVSSATSAMAQQAQATAVKARGTQAEGQAHPAGQGEGVKRGLGGLLRPKKLSSPTHSAVRLPSATNVPAATSRKAEPPLQDRQSWTAIEKHSDEERLRDFYEGLLPEGQDAGETVVQHATFPIQNEEPRVDLEDRCTATQNPVQVPLLGSPTADEDLLESAKHEYTSGNPFSSSPSPELAAARSGNPFVQQQSTHEQEDVRRRTSDDGIMDHLLDL